jgi:hypothetical protein
MQPRKFYHPAGPRKVQRCSSNRNGRFGRSVATLTVSTSVADADMVRPVCDHHRLVLDLQSRLRKSFSPRGVEYFGKFHEIDGSEETEKIKRYPRRSSNLHSQCNATKEEGVGHETKQWRGCKRSFDECFDEHLYLQSRLRVVENAMNIARIAAQKRFVGEWRSRPVDAVSQYAEVLRTSTGLIFLQKDRKDKVEKRFERFLGAGQQHRRKRMKSIFKDPEPIRGMPIIDEQSALKSDFALVGKTCIPTRQILGKIRFPADADIHPHQPIID